MWINTFSFVCTQRKLNTIGIEMPYKGFNTIILLYLTMIGIYIPHIVIFCYIIMASRRFSKAGTLKILWRVPEIHIKWIYVSSVRPQDRRRRWEWAYMPLYKLYVFQIRKCAVWSDDDAVRPQTNKIWRRVCVPSTMGNPALQGQTRGHETLTNPNPFYWRRTQLQ